MHDRFQPSRQGRIEFRPDHVFIALAFHRAHAQPPDAHRGGKQQQTEHHAEHNARRARMTGQRIGFGKPFAHFTWGKHLFDRIRRRLRHGNGRDRLFQHIRGLVRVSDDWLEFVGHNHREYGIGSTVCANGMKI